MCACVCRSVVRVTFDKCSCCTAPSALSCLLQSDSCNHTCTQSRSGANTGHQEFGGRASLGPDFISAGGQQPQGHWNDCDGHGVYKCLLCVWLCVRGMEGAPWTLLTSSQRAASSPRATGTTAMATVCMSLVVCLVRSHALRACEGS